MFTGIIEQTGVIQAVITTGANTSFWVTSSLWQDLKIDQSLSHNGVCLTIEEINDGMHRVTAIAETLAKTNLSHWQKGTIVNLERCMPVNGRFDGHIVQGHVDTVAVCTAVIEKEGSWEYSFSFEENFSNLIIEKGSITLNGISLTLFNVGNISFSVAIIPYTDEHTNMHTIKIGDSVNIEFDILGKYIERILSQRL
jgi:riboflavin synthase